MPRIVDGGMRLSRGARNPALKDLLGAGSNRIAVAEGRQERLLETAQRTPGSPILRGRGIIRPDRDEARAPAMAVRACSTPLTVEMPLPPLNILVFPLLSGPVSPWEALAAV